VITYLYQNIILTLSLQICCIPVTYHVSRHSVSIVPLYGWHWIPRIAENVSSSFW